MRNLLAAIAALVLAGCQAQYQTEGSAPMSASVSSSAVVSAPPPPMPPRWERRMMVTINFDLNSHHIRPESYYVLDSVAAGLRDQRLQGSLFEVNGHTDVSGRLGYNMTLSYLRAQSVMSYLISRGVPPDALRAQGFGPLHLLYPQAPFHRDNRRVEIVAVSY